MLSCFGGMPNFYKYQAVNCTDCGSPNLPYCFRTYFPLPYLLTYPITWQNDEMPPPPKRISALHCRLFWDDRLKGDEMGERNQGKKWVLTLLDLKSGVGQEVSWAILPTYVWFGRHFAAPIKKRLWHCAQSVALASLHHHVIFQTSALRAENFYTNQNWHWIRNNNLRQTVVASSMVSPGHTCLLKLLKTRTWPVYFSDGQWLHKMTLNIK